MSPTAVRLDIATIDLFEPALGSEFDVAVEFGGPTLATFVLVEATRLGHPTPAGRPPFSLVFSGPAAVSLPQGIYSLTNPMLGNLEIFIVPIGGNADARQYQAIFN